MLRIASQWYAHSSWLLIHDCSEKNKHVFRRENERSRSDLDEPALLIRKEPVQPDQSRIPRRGKKLQKLAGLTSNIAPETHYGKYKDLPPPTPTRLKKRKEKRSRARPRAIMHVPVASASRSLPCRHGAPDQKHCPPRCSHPVRRCLSFTSRRCSLPAL